MNKKTDNWNLQAILRIRTVAAVLLAVAFVFSQSVAQQHIHVDGELTASCVVCHHADNSPAVTANPAVTTSANLQTCVTQFVQVAIFVAAPAHDHLSRAPPTAG